jgi:hypothetical protein
MKRILLIGAFLLMAGVAFAHQEENCSKPLPECGGTCFYTDGPTDGWHNGGNCYSDVNGFCHCST